MKVGTYGQKLIFNVVKEDGSPLVLTDALTVKAYLLIEGRTRAKEFACEVENATAGTVSYVVENGDLDKAGIATIEIEVQFIDGLFVSEDVITERIHKRVKTEA
jgi:hypothetical protein